MDLYTLAIAISVSILTFFVKPIYGLISYIAVADAWHHPVSCNQPGLSVMIARTARGKQIIEQAVLDGFIEAETVSPEILPLCRPGQAASQGGLWARMRTLKAMRAPIPDYRGLDLFRLWVSELSIMEKIRSILSTIRRVFVKKLCRRRDINELIVQQETKRELD